jgi:hypothetical protein
MKCKLVKVMYFFCVNMVLEKKLYKDIELERHLFVPLYLKMAYTNYTWNCLSDDLSRLKH